MKFLPIYSLSNCDSLVVRSKLKVLRCYSGVGWSTKEHLQNGKYIIERKLGQGTSEFNTYLVKDQQGNRWIVKTLNEDLLKTLSYPERERLEQLFWGEALQLTKCKHRHIPKIKDPFREDGKWCSLMEYVSGATLAERAKKVLSTEEAVDYVQQISEALVVVHEQQLVHRDVRPENIILRINEGQPEAVLIGFGLALEFDNAIATMRTKERSEGFTPPELYPSSVHNIGAWTDVYSLAATLYDLVTGEHPPDALRRKVDRIRPKPPNQLNTQLSKLINDAILRGIELNPKKRPQSVKEWLVSLGLAERSTIASELTLFSASKRGWAWATIWAAVGLH
jgi:eukaryotic-like serine/threonine-protein kinase